MMTKNLFIHPTKVSEVAMIDLGDFSVSLLRKRIKNINLRINRCGDVQISAPIKTPMKAIYHFLQSKLSWIETHRQRLQQLERQAPSQWLIGEYIPFQGRQYALQVYETESTHRIELHENQLHLFIKPDTSQAHKELYLNSWYHSQMQACLPALLNKWQATMGVTVVKVSIKRMKSRWGSCNPIKKHINLNLRLIEKPLICLEYVLVHELVHLFEPSHNKRFYALMSQFLPDWKQRVALM